MDRITHFYNQSYIYLNLKLDKNIAAQNDKINTAVEVFFNQRGIQDRNISNREKLMVKAEIIKTYKNEKSNDKEMRLKKAIHISTAKMESKLMLSKISSTPIRFSKIENYKEKKAAFLNEIKNSTLKSDDIYKKHLDNPKIQQLAATIERDFLLYQHLESANLSTGMTLNDFAHLLLLKYEPAIYEIFTSEGMKAAGRDDIIAVYVPLILLQKGDDFANAVIALSDNLEKQNDNVYAFLAPLASKTSSPKCVIEGIQNYKTPS